MAKSRARKLADIIVGAGIDIDGNLTFDGGSTSADLTFADNDKANFGDASDLQIFHNGSHSFIKDAGTGDLYIGASNNLALMNSAFSENYLLATTDGAVTLYYDGSSKLATTSSGISVTGTANASKYAATGDSDTYFNFPAANQLSLVGGGAEIVRAYQLAGAYGILRVNGSGSATYPNFTFNGDENTGMYQAAADNLAFATGGSQRMRINSNGHLLVGTTDAGVYDDSTDEGGHNLLANGQYYNSTASEINMILNRQNSDGDIIQLREDGAVVGSLFNSGTTMGVGSLDTGLLLANNIDAILPWNASTNAERGNAIDLGRASSGRFKDLHLNGYAYVGALKTNQSIESVSNLTFWVANVGEAARIEQGTGNVGIGTTSPSAKLDVRRSDASGVVAEFHNNVGYGLKFTVQSDGGVNTINSESNQALAFATNGASNERMRIDSSGNVLIGKTDTTFNTSGIALRSADVVQVTRSGDTALEINRTSNDGKLAGFFRSGVLFGSIGAINSNNLFIGSTSSNHSGIQFGTAVITPMLAGSENNGSVDIGFSNARFKDLYLSNKVYAAYIGEAGDTDTSINFDTADTIKLVTGGTERMRIDSSGRVGIGESNLSDTFEISGGNIVNPNSTGSEITSATFGIGQNIHLEERQVNGAYSDRTDLAIVTNTGFGLGESEKIRIEASGSVGIGTSSPGALLDVNDEGVTDNAWNTLAKFRPDLSDQHAETSIHIQSYPSTTVVADRAAGIQSIDDAGTTRPLVLNKAGGNVGIGTDNPGAALDVERSSGWAEVHLNGASGGDLILQDNGVNIGEIYAGVGHGMVLKSFASQDMHFLTNANATAKMTIKADGKVGIGTTDPKNQLHVNGGGYFTGFTNPNGSGVAGLELGFDGTQSVLQSYHRGTSSYKGINMNAAHVAFNIGGVEKARVHSNGNVGIGTSSPFARLHIDQAGNTINDGLFIERNGSTYGLNLYVNSGGYGIIGGNGGFTPDIIHLDFNQQDVGIGTAPVNNYKLEVYDGDYTQMMLRAPSYPVLRFKADNQNSGNNGRISVGANNSFNFDPNSTTVGISIANDGKVGIGTTSPFAKSHIVDIGWSSGAPYGTVQLIEGNNVNDNNWGHLVVTDTTTSAGNGGAISFATGASNALNPFAGIKGVSEGAAYGGIGLFTRASGGTATERVRINSSGKVGIGGSVMQGQKLNIEGWTQSNTRTPTNAWLVGRGTGGDGLAIGTSASTPYATWFQSGYLPTMGTSNHYALSFNPHGGNVGIGTENPTAKLHVLGGGSKIEHTNGGISFVKAGAGSSTNSDYMAAILRTDTAGYHVTTNNGGFGSVADGLAIMNHGDLFFATAPTTGGGTNYPSGRVMIKSTGNVGIGTPSPSTTLHIKSGANSNDGAIRIESATSNVMTLGTDGTGHFLNCVNTDPFRIKFAGSEKMRIKADGKVGINTTDPKETLTVEGAICSKNGSGDLATHNQNSHATPVASGSIEFTAGYSGTLASGRVLTFTYEATSWKSWIFEIEVASTHRLTTIKAGGYNNNSMSSNIYEVGDANNGGTLTVTNSGQHNVFTFTVNTGMTHPVLRVKYTQSGGDGAPRMDRMKLVIT